MTTSGALDTRFRVRYTCWIPGLWDDYSTAQVNHFLWSDVYGLVRANERWIVFQYLSDWNIYRRKTYVIVRRTRP